MSEEVKTEEVPKEELVDPKSLEEALLKVDTDSEKALDKVISNGELDGAAQFFKMYVPLCRNGIARMSSRELRRTLMALIEAPLNDKPYKPNPGIEGQVYQIADRLIQAKYMMMHAVLIQQETDKLNGINKENETNEQHQQQSQEEVQSSSSGVST